MTVQEERLLCPSLTVINIVIFIQVKISKILNKVERRDRSISFRLVWYM